MTQLWLAYIILNDVHLMRSCLRYISSGDLSFFVDLDQEEPFPGGEAPFAECSKAVIDGYEALLDKVDAGELSPEEAANQML